MEVCKYCGAIAGLTSICLECTRYTQGIAQLTFEDCAYFIVRRLQVTHAQLLRMPDWTAEDLKELKPRLRQYVLGQMALKAEVRRRIDHAERVATGEAF